MPLGGALSLGVGSSLLSGAIGSKGSKSAAKTLQQNAAKIVPIVQQAVGQAQAGVGDATATGLTGISGATSSGQQGIAGGVTDANKILQDSAQQQQALYNPYIQAGTNSLSQIQQLSGPGGALSRQFSFDPNNIANNPGYQFTLKQGEDAIQRSAAANGGLFSGGTMKSLAGYATGSAAQYENQLYNQALSTFQTNQQQALNQVGTLQGLAGLGGQATSASANALGTSAAGQSQNLYGGGIAGAGLGLQGAQAAGTLGLAGATQQGNYGLQGSQIIGQTLTGGAQGQAAGQVGAANAWSNALASGSNNILNYLTYQNLGGAGLGPTGLGGYSSAGGLNIPLSPSGALPTTPYTGGHTDANGNWVVT